MRAIGAALVAVLMGAAAAAATVPFRVASADGRTWISPGKLGGKPSVLLFWDVDCAPCLGELQNAAALRAAWPEAAVVIVELSPRAASARALARYKVPPAVIRAVAPQDPRGLLARLGNRSGALPFSAAFARDGRSCAAQLGPLTPASLRAVARRC